MADDPKVIDAEFWEVAEVGQTGRQIVRIPIPTDDRLTSLQEAYLIKKSMPGMSAKGLDECVFLVEKAKRMGLSAIKGDVSLIEGRMAVSDAAKGRAVVSNPNLAEFSVSEPMQVSNPLICACGHPFILHEVDAEGKPTGKCKFIAELKNGTKTCSCANGRQKLDVYVAVTGKMRGWAIGVTVKTWLSEWYNPKNDAWVEYTYDRLIAKAIARWGERCSPIGEDTDAFIETALPNVPPAGLPGADRAKELETGLRGLLAAPQGETGQAEAGASPAATDGPSST